MKEVANNEDRFSKLLSPETSFEQMSLFPFITSESVYQYTSYVEYVKNNIIYERMRW
jgi:hypothetical protein